MENRYRVRDEPSLPEVLDIYSAPLGVLIYTTGKVREGRHFLSPRWVILVGNSR
jgi:hypothetical protein